MLRNEEYATVSIKRLICHTGDLGRLNSSKETLTANGPRRSPPEDCDGSTSPSRPAELNDTVLLFMLLCRVSKQGGPRQSVRGSLGVDAVSLEIPGPVQKKKKRHTLTTSRQGLILKQQYN